MTPEDRELFGEYLNHWQARLGLKDWRIAFDSKPASRGVMAEVAKFDLEARTAKIRLGQSKDWGKEPITPENLSKTALHELLHVLLHEPLELARNPDLDAQMRSAEHRVINILEQVIADGSPESQ